MEQYEKQDLNVISVEVHLIYYPTDFYLYIPSLYFIIERKLTIKYTETKTGPWPYMKSNVLYFFDILRDSDPYDETV